MGPYPSWEEEVDWSPDFDTEKPTPSSLSWPDPAPAEVYEDTWWGEEEPEDDEELLAFYQDENNDAGLSSGDEEAAWIYSEDLSRELDTEEVEMSFMAFAEAKRALHQRRLSRGFGQKGQVERIVQRQVQTR